MDNALKALCQAIKKALVILKPEHNPVSFILLTGKTGQGKTALLTQSHLNQIPIDLQYKAQVFYNKQGVVVELGETWLNQNQHLLAYSLKRINQCHPYVRINGLFVCVDVHELIMMEPHALFQYCETHIQLAQRFGQALGHALDTALIMTKLDNLAGFNEFFLHEHENELMKPLGFSLMYGDNKKRFLYHFSGQYDNFLEMLGQQVIKKLHPVRSTAKRTLIREFPIQMAHLRVGIQALLQAASPQSLNFQALFFTSAEQGGFSYDGLNQKIYHEYALTIPNKIIQSINYQSYFIDGAIRAFQRNTKHHYPKITPRQKQLIAAMSAGVLVFLFFLGHQHISTSNVLEDAGKELLAYELLANQPKAQNQALYHLIKAEGKLTAMPNTLLSYPLVNQLRTQLQHTSEHLLHKDFLPKLVNILQQTFGNMALSPFERMKALKIYLMLGQPAKYSEQTVESWFKQYWHEHYPNKPIEQEMLLLKNALKQPFQPIDLDENLIRDARNYMNALPAGYLYYALAKESFPKEHQALVFDGFDLSARELPVYFTKKGFYQTFHQIPEIAKHLAEDAWVLQRQDIQNIQTEIEQAYCQEYIHWWQNFMRRSMPSHYQGYEQAQALAARLEKSQTISKLVQLIQQETSPDVGEEGALFNQKIANHLTEINLLTASATRSLEETIQELGKFIAPLILIKDGGRTIFEMTKARFIHENNLDPLSMLYLKARQLPEPAATWAKQIADDMWFVFIQDSKTYLNHLWREQVFTAYETTIAHRYPFEPKQVEEINITQFNAFFAPKGILTAFIQQHLKPFLDTSKPQWQAREVNGYRLPISDELLNELIRAHVISKMFYPDNADQSHITFSLQKIELDPVVANLQFSLGNTVLTDSQSSEAYAYFDWPMPDAKLEINAIDGQHYVLEEHGIWAFFKLLQKVNVLVDNNDSANLQILFEVNGNAGRYALRTQNKINPFSPGILTGFYLPDHVA